MSDGSNMGITANRALGTIIGNADQPSENEKASREDVLARVMAAPSPLEGESIYSRPGKDAYSLAADCIAKAFLLVEAEAPGTLEIELYYTKENTDIESLWGMKKDAATASWDAVVDRWPTFDNWLGGATGFQVGFAYNTARWLNEKPIVGNPAIMTIG